MRGVATRAQSGPKDARLMCPESVCPVELLGAGCHQCDVISVLLEKGGRSEDLICTDHIGWQHS